MKVIVFGASGGIGRHAVSHALRSGYEVTAFLRHPEKLKIADKRLHIIQGEISDAAAVADALQGQDAVLWCVGIPMKGRYGKMESLEGHQILIDAMRRQNVSRLIDWATPSVPSERDQKSFVTMVPGILAGLVFKMAKQEILEIAKLIEKSGLDWTIVRFMAPQNSAYQGKVKVSFGNERINLAISREDIAAFMMEQIGSKAYLHAMPIIGS